MVVGEVHLRPTSLKILVSTFLHCHHANSHLSHPLRCYKFKFAGQQLSFHHCHANGYQGRPLTNCVFISTLLLHWYHNINGCQGVN